MSAPSFSGARNRRKRKETKAMSDGYQTNAMAEIALALAMAFFSIMVLTMVSMGAGMDPGPGTPAPYAPEDGIALSPSGLGPASNGESASAARAVPPGSLLIYDRGTFLDARLETVEPEAFADGAETPIVLAVPPGLSLREAMAARKRVPGDKVTVTTLDGKWIKKLKERTR